MLILENYEEHEKHLPTEGKFIIAQFDNDSIIIYQAFKDSIAEYAVAHQHFGGNDYEFDRTTWLKPSFLWMMHYSGWAKKENQENVLAIRIKKRGFDEILQLSVLATYYREIHETQAKWEKEVNNADILLQWEPYHDLLGYKTDRKAVKIGLKGAMLQRYNNEWILGIENITPFVKKQQALIMANELSSVQVPRERAYAPADLTILRKIDATCITL